jgi:tetratricopeptide (TPR) repeat protein
VIFEATKRSLPASLHNTSVKDNLMRRDTRTFLLAITLVAAGVLCARGWSLALQRNLAQVQLTKASLVGDLDDDKTQLALKRAALVFSRILSYAPGNSEAAISLGQSYFLNGDLKEAEEVWALASSNLSFDQSLRLYRWMFRQEQHTGYDFNTIHQLSSAVGLEFPESYVQIGKTYWEAREFEPAEHYLNQALQIAARYDHKFLQNEVEAHFWLGRVFYRQGENLSAGEHFQAVVTLDPENQWFWYTHPAYLFLGDIDLAQGECEQADFNYGKALITSISEKQDGQALEKCRLLTETESCRLKPLKSCAEMLE